MDVVAMFGNEGSVERNGAVLPGIVRQLEYAGERIDLALLRSLLDAAVRDGRITEVVGPWGPEYRFGRSPEYQKVRACIDAAYAATDRLPRDTEPTTYGPMEKYRPQAWAIVMGHLRVRWGRGEYGVPTFDEIRSWCPGFPW